jgi:hypothetical protein
MPVPSPFFLRQPDLPAWHDAPRYSLPIARTLRVAYALVNDRPNNLAAGRKAHDIAIPNARRSMCVQQRMKLNFIPARCAMEMGESRLTLAMLDCALEYSTRLDDWRSTAELLYNAGATKRAFMQPRAPLGDLRASRAIIDNLKGSHIAVAPDLELSIVFASANAAFFQARYEDALVRLDEADGLHHGALSTEMERDRITWTRAVVLTYLGRPDASLPILMGVAGRTDTMENPVAFRRVYAAVAYAALDLAERARDRGEDRLMLQLLHTAQTNAIKGFERCDAAFDPGGATLARLALVRQSQFVEDSNIRRKIIVDAWRFAENTDEHDVMAQARIALARELVAQGDITSAQTLLRQGVARSSVARFPSPANWQRRCCAASAAMTTGEFALSDLLRCCDILTSSPLFAPTTQRTFLALVPPLFPPHIHIDLHPCRITTYLSL